MMRSFLLLAIAGAVLSACSDQKIEQPPIRQSAPAPTPVAAAPRPELPATAPPPMATPAAPSEVSATPPESARCLELVERAAFSEAVPVCVRAAGLDPNNTAVQQALATARARSAAAASAAVDQASQGAASALPGQLGKKPE